LSKIIPIYIALLLFWKSDYIITAYELVKYWNRKKYRNSKAKSKIGKESWPVVRIYTGEMRKEKPLYNFYIS